MLAKQSLAAIGESDDEDEDSDDGEVRPTEFVKAQTLHSGVAGVTSNEQFSNISQVSGSENVRPTEMPQSNSGARVAATDSLQALAAQVNEEMKEVDKSKSDRGETYIGDVDEEKATIVGFRQTDDERGRTSAWNNDMDEGKQGIDGFENDQE